MDDVPGTTGADATPPTRCRCDRYRPSSCHGIVGSDGIRRCMMRGHSTVTGFGGFGGFTGFGGFGGFTGFGCLLLARCGFASRADCSCR